MNQIDIPFEGASVLFRAKEARSDAGFIIEL